MRCARVRVFLFLSRRIPNLEQKLFLTIYNVIISTNKQDREGLQVRVRILVSFSNIIMNIKYLLIRLCAKLTEDLFSILFVCYNCGPTLTHYLFIISLLLSLFFAESAKLGTVDNIANEYCHTETKVELSRHRHKTIS